MFPKVACEALQWFLLSGFRDLWDTSVAATVDSLSSVCLWEIMWPNQIYVVIWKKIPAMCDNRIFRIPN